MRPSDPERQCAGLGASVVPQLCLFHEEFTLPRITAASSRQRPSPDAASTPLSLRAIFVAVAVGTDGLVTVDVDDTLGGMDWAQW